MLKIIYVYKQEDSSTIECYVGMETQASPALIQSSRSISSISKLSENESNAGQMQYSAFNTMINIEQKLLDFIAEENIQTVKDVMANTDKFSKNTTFLRIAWKEVNNLAGGEVKTSPAKKIKQQKLQHRQKTRLRIDVNNS